MIFYHARFGLVELAIYGNGEDILIAYGEDCEFAVSVEYFIDNYEFIGFI